VTPPDAALIQAQIDNLTKPRGALGQLEALAAQLCRIQGTLTPSLASPAILVFAADHGLAREPVSAYPREVTAQMAVNVLQGGAGINVFCRQHAIAVTLVDAGVDWPGPRPAGIVNRWLGPGTASSLAGDAMTAEQVQAGLAAGASVVDEFVPASSTVVGFGELGIGNTSAASLVAAALTGLPLPELTGPGTGLAGAGLAKKLAVLEQVRAAHPAPATPRDALRMFGGFEIVQMAGAMRRAWERGLVLLIDGFVATAAFLAARAEAPAIQDHAVFCHESGEPGHARLLDWLDAAPLLRLGLRLGEGTGCAVAYPVLQSAVAMLQMASFAGAGVSTGQPEAS
jgi:nicotinate-nucleotide--dimethylbenzimidazole phosphoribosyltransferase